MRTTRRTCALAATFLLAAGAAGCANSIAGSGSFSKTLAVNGPVHLELVNGSGSASITVGQAGQVVVRGAFKVRAWPWENGPKRVADLTANPPIEQEGNLIRIGSNLFRLTDLEVNYTIEVPVESEVHATGGSGAVQVRGVRGPVRMTTGSGDLTAEQIGDDVEATAGSGDIRLTDIKGEAQTTTGSGNIALSNIAGQARVAAGSGDITINQPGGSVEVKTGSGDVAIAGAAADLRIRTGSGELNINGKPRAGSYWDFHTFSGSVTLNVPHDASFRFHAHSSSSEIHSDLPMAVEEQSRRELRARIGDGAARVEVETASGDIRLQ